MYQINIFNYKLRILCYISPDRWPRCKQNNEISACLTPSNLVSPNPHAKCMPLRNWILYQSIVIHLIYSTNHSRDEKNHLNPIDQNDIIIIFRGNIPTLFLQIGTCTFKIDANVVLNAKNINNPTTIGQ